MAFSTAGMLLLAVAGLLYCHGVDAQFRVLVGEEAENLPLDQSPENLEIAARTGDTITVDYTMPTMAVVVQEDVNAILNCLPWLMQYPGGSIRWLRVQLDEFGNMGNTEVLERTVTVPPPRRIVTGQFNHIVNITRTIIVPGGQDPDAGIYVCEVCTDRGGPAETCHFSNTTVWGIGSPPDINETDSDSPPDSVITQPDGRQIINYRIGADFCIRQDSLRILTLECDIIDRVEQVIPGAFPTPDRTWRREGVEVYTQEDGQSAADALDMSDFFMQGSNLIFMPEVVVGANPLIANNEGSLIFEQFEAGDNLTDDAAIRMQLDALDINNNNFQRALFEQILGTWVCSANNSIGSDIAQSTIRECGIDPVIPGCPGDNDDILFPDDQEVVPVGCNICAPEGSETLIDCTVSEGTPPIEYVWTDGGGNVLSINPILRVTQEGNYTCDVSNADRDQVLATSVLAFSPRADFNGDLSNPFVGDIDGNGCDRLFVQPDPPVDFCPFVGEQLDITCVSEGGMPLNITGPADMAVGLLSIGSVTPDNAEGEFSCRLNVPGFCSEASRVLTSMVYDPARIDRESDLGSDPFTFGPGRSQAPFIASNVTVTLVCPSTGIDDPENIWYQIVVDEFGVASERRVENEGRFSIVNGTNGGFVTATLTITNFGESPTDQGTYVCRATNNAGVDAATVTILNEPDRFDWIPGGFGDCTPDCRGGVQFRSVVCRSLWDNRVVPDHFCTDTPPPSSRNCTELDDVACLLTPVWISSRFSRCSRGCTGGFRSRTVNCVIPRTGEVVEDYRCNDLRKPNPFDFCANTCCVTDEYPSFCRYATAARCSGAQFRRFCCWTCGLTYLP